MCLRTVRILRVTRHTLMEFIHGAMKKSFHTAVECAYVDPHMYVQYVIRIRVTVQ